MNRANMIGLVVLCGALPLAGCGTSTGMLAGAGFGGIDRTYEPQFTAIDGDGDKQITYADMHAWLAKVLAENDADRDGALSAAEIPPTLLMPRQDGKGFVTAYDTSADDKVSLDELKVNVNVLFQRDQNADGTLTLAEVQQAPKQKSEITSGPGTNSAGGVIGGPSAGR